jgi:hypothetical protein
VVSAPFGVPAIGHGSVFVDKLTRRAKIPKLTWTGSSMVEQLTLNQRVAGSSPARFTKTPNKTQAISALPSVSVLS